MKFYAHISGLLCAGLLLSSCNPFESNPTAKDISKAFNNLIPVADITNVTCVAAVGAPGRSCSFDVDGSPRNRRFTKDDHGQWQHD